MMLSLLSVGKVRAMTEPYTPTTYVVRDSLAFHESVCGCTGRDYQAVAEEFDRWLAAHDKEVLGKYGVSLAASYNAGWMSALEIVVAHSRIAEPPTTDRTFVQYAEDVADAIRGEVLDEAAEWVKAAEHRMSLKLHEHWDDALPEDECDCCAAEVVTIAIAAIRREGERV